MAEQIIEQISFDKFSVTVYVGDIATAMLLNTKVDKIDGKGLSSNDFTDEEKQEIYDNTLARHTHANKTALDLVSGVNTGDQDISNLATNAEVVHLVGEEINKLLPLIYAGL